MKEAVYPVYIKSFHRQNKESKGGLGNSHEKEKDTANRHRKGHSTLNIPSKHELRIKISTPCHLSH